MPEIRFDRFYRYDDLTRLVQAFAEEHPHLMRVESIGKSHEGRDIWVVTVTNFATGAGQREARALGGRQHPRDRGLAVQRVPLSAQHTWPAATATTTTITRCLDTRAFYICPRLNPDGAEWALADAPKFIRSSTRPYPYDEEHVARPADARMSTATGACWLCASPTPTAPGRSARMSRACWCAASRTRRAGNITACCRRVNCATSTAWRSRFSRRRRVWTSIATFRRSGGRSTSSTARAPIPTSEPEVRALVDFIAEHPQHHRRRRLPHLRRRAAPALQPPERRELRRRGPVDVSEDRREGHGDQRLSQHLGLPRLQVPPKGVITGALDDWMVRRTWASLPGRWRYGARSARRASPTTSIIDWFREHPLEDDLKLLKWSDEALGGKGYVDWYPFEHPQLGPVELGGWDAFYAFSQSAARVPRTRAREASRAGWCGNCSSRPGWSSSRRARRRSARAHIACGWRCRIAAGCPAT